MNAHVFGVWDFKDNLNDSFRSARRHLKQIARLRPRWKSNCSARFLTDWLRRRGKEALCLKRTNPFWILKPIEEIAMVFSVSESSHRRSHMYGGVTFSSA